MMYVCNVKHYTVYLKLLQYCMSIISIKLEGKQSMRRKMETQKKIREEYVRKISLTKIEVQMNIYKYHISLEMRHKMLYKTLSAIIYSLNFLIAFWKYKISTPIPSWHKQRWIQFFWKLHWHEISWVLKTVKNKQSDLKVPLLLSYLKEIVMTIYHLVEPTHIPIKWEPEVCPALVTFLCIFLNLVAFPPRTRALQCILTSAKPLFYIF